MGNWFLIEDIESMDSGTEEHNLPP